MPITDSETVKIEMNIVMAIRDFFLGFFFCLNNRDSINDCFERNKLFLYAQGKVRAIAQL